MHKRILPAALCAAVLFFQTGGPLCAQASSTINTVKPARENAWDTDGHTLAHWDFQRIKDNKIKDLTWIGHTLSLHGDPFLVDGDYGNAIQLNQNYLSLDDDKDLCPDVICVEALIRMDRYPLEKPKHSMVVANCTWTATDCFGYELRITDKGKVEFVIGTDDGWKSAITTSKLKLDKWYHIAGQYDGEELTVFVNDEMVARTPYKGLMNPNQSHGMNIGRRVKDQPFYFLGAIDEVRISDTLRY